MTSWPLAWSVSPANPNWEGTVGDTLSFSVRAIPDPTFPDTWDYGGGDDGNGGTLPTNPLPPEPTDIVVTVEDDDLNDDSLYNVDGDEVTVSVNDVRIFLPFESIKFEKDEQVYTVHYEQDLYDVGFDFVFEFIPFQGAFDTRFISLKAESTWEDGPLTGTFIFRINNNFDAVRSALRVISADSEEYLSNLEDGDGSVGDFDDSGTNSTTINTPTFNSSYEERDILELFPDDEDEEIDRFVRNGDDEEVERRIGDGSGLKKTPKQSSNPTPNTIDGETPDDDLQNWFDNLGNNNG